MTESNRDEKSRPPLRARLHRYHLTTAEFALLTAMAEHCSDGSTIYAAVPRLAAYAKLSARQVERIIHGYDDARSGKRVAGLTERGILTELAPHNGRKRRPATYHLNEDALQLDPRMRRYLHQEKQRILPGILKPPKQGIPELPVSDSQCNVPPSPCQEVPSNQPTGTPLTRRRGSPDIASRAEMAFPPSPCRESHVTASNDSKTSDPKARPKSRTIQKTGIHHGDATLNSLPAWLALKEALRKELSDEEWNLWVRPMCLLRAMSTGNGKHLLAALPPVSRILDAAQARLPLLRELLAPSSLSISLTGYPDEWEIEQCKSRYGIDMSPRPWRGT
jgi:hypothetical protein